MELAKNLSSCLEFFKRQAISSPQKEIVGFLGLKDGKPVAKITTNRSPNPQEYFMVDPMEFYSFDKEFEFIAVFHSHIYGDSEFSDFDRDSSENSVIPFIVYSLPEDKFNIYEPSGHDVDENVISTIKSLW